jgi:hypothetical protein
MYVRKAIAVAGNHEALGLWNPNKVLLRDDGTQGDVVAGDGIWTIELGLPEGFELEYKYTNSGAEGSWSPGEEFSGNNRRIKVQPDASGRMIINDAFGKM